MNRMIACGVFILAMSFALGGCQKSDSWEKWTTQQTSLEKNGQVICCVVDSFDKNFYNVEELSGMAVEEASAFNASHKSGSTTPVVVEEVKKIGEAENYVRVVYRFDKVESYSTFFGETFLYKTLEDESIQKYLYTGAVLTDGKKDFVMDAENKSKYAKKHVVVTDAKTVLHLPCEVLCFSSGVVLREDGSVDLTACQDTAVIVLKK